MQRLNYPGSKMKFLQLLVACKIEVKEFILWNVNYN